MILSVVFTVFKNEVAVDIIHKYRVSRSIFALKDIHSNLVFQIVLDCTAQRTCTEQRIKADLTDFVQSRFGNIQTNILLLHTFSKLTNLDTGDFANSLLIKGI